MASDKSGNSLITFFAGIFLGVIGYHRLQQYTEKIEEQLQAKADQQVMETVLVAIAQKIGVPIATLHKVIDNPQHDPSAVEALRANYRACKLVFVPQDAHWIEVTYRIQWRDDTATLIQTRWEWDRLPIEIRKQLFRSGKQPITVSWDLPDALTE
jgi:hypothetical protein